MHTGLRRSRASVGPVVGRMLRVTWLNDHLVLLSAVLLVALIVIGLIVIAVRGIALVRRISASRRAVDPHVATLTQSIGQAEARVDGIAGEQEELLETIDRVRAGTDELGRLVGAASAAIAVLRSPLRYFGR